MRPRAMANLARDALAAARRVRIQVGASAESPICIFSLVENHFRDELELRFKAAPSLEGIYVRGEHEADQSGLIIVSSLRPSGRQRTTCAHELGHHLFGHGTSVDKVIESGSSDEFEPNEYLANCFASFLTMPKLGIMKAFADRQIRIPAASAVDVYTVASQFGVGFTTLINHLDIVLGLLSREQAKQLLKAAPKGIRKNLLGYEATGELLVVDKHWAGRAVDLSVGDHVAFPTGSTVEGDKLRFVGHRPIGDVYVATRVGRGRVQDASSPMAAYVRVSRFQYQGRGMFRHLEECDDE